MKEPQKANTPKNRPLPKPPIVGKPFDDPKMEKAFKQVFGGNR